jgi:hypothetical protein
MDKDDIERRKAELIAETNTVFDGISRSGSVGLHEFDAAFDYGDVEKARRKDCDRKWQETEVDSVEGWVFVLGLIGKIGFRYYLPAFMIHCLKEHHEYYVLKLLAEKLYDPRWGAFKDREEKTIARYLQFLSDLADWETLEYLRGLGWSEEDVAAQFEEEVAYSTSKRAITRALNQYWGQFLNLPEKTW